VVEFRVGRFYLEGHGVVCMGPFEFLLVQVDITLVKVMDSVVRIELNSLLVLFDRFIHNDVVFRTSSG
jgi:hypothetical protein